MMRVILQKSFTDCGFACLAMVCDHYHLPIDYAQIASVLSPATWEKGLSLKILRDLSNRLGLRGIPRICPLSAAATVECPLIAHCKDNHYVVVERLTNDRVTIVDPRYGRIALAQAEFDDMYSGICLQLTLSSKEIVDLSDSQADSGPWEAKIRHLAAKWLVVLTLTSLLHVIVLALCGALTLCFVPYNCVAFPLAVTLIFMIDILLGMLVTEKCILSTYAVVVSEFATACSREGNLLFEIPDGYRIEERVRWIAEHVYQSRWNALSIGKLTWGLVLIVGLAFMLRDWMLLGCTLVLCFSAWWEVKRLTRGIDFAASDHSARRFISTTIDRVFHRRVGGYHSQPIGRTVTEVSCDSISSLAVCGSLLIYWWSERSVMLQPGTALILLVAQLKLFEWWCISRQGVSSWLTIAHSYSHLSFMSFLRRRQVASVPALARMAR